MAKSVFTCFQICLLDTRLCTVVQHAVLKPAVQIRLKPA